MKKTYKLKNLECGNCAAKIERAVKKLAGVESVTVTFMTQRMDLELNEQKMPELTEEIKKIVHKYEPDTILVG